MRKGSFNNFRNLKKAPVLCRSVGQQGLCVGSVRNLIVAKGVNDIDNVSERFDVRGVQLIKLVHVLKDFIELLDKAIFFRHAEAQAGQSCDALHVLPGEFHAIFVTQATRQFQFT